MRKKKMIIAVSIVAVVLLAVGIFTVYQMNRFKKLETMSAQEMLTAVTQKSDTYVAVAILKDDEITLQTYGQNGQEIDRNDYDFEIGSATKTMVSLLMAKAVSEGRLQLTDSISKYLDVPAGKYYPTIERILTHTSGYKNYYYEKEMKDNFFHGSNSFYNVTKEEMLARVGKVTLEDKDYPFKYSNFGISVLGLVLEEVYQKDMTSMLEDYLREEIGLQNTSVASGTGNLTGYWDWNREDAYVPAGAVISDIGDMAKYMDFYRTSELTYVSQPMQPLKVVDANNSTYVKMNIRIDEVGMAWMHDTVNHFYWHNGGTSKYNSYFALSEDKRIGVVLLSNYGPNENIPVTVIGAKMMQDLRKSL